MRRKTAPGNPHAPRKSAEIPSDVNGSYTGVPKTGSRPVQDADDL